MSAVEKEQPEAAKTRFAKDQLKAFVERIERLEEEKKTISDDIRDVYAESKGNGFDVKALRAVVRLPQAGRPGAAGTRTDSRNLSQRAGHAGGVRIEGRHALHRSGLPAAAASLGFVGAFGGVHFAVDDLKIGQAPIRQELGPRRVAPLAPDAKQRHPVVDLGGLPQPPPVCAQRRACRRRSTASWSLGAFQSRHATTQAVCHAARRFGPASQRSRCQPKRYTGCPHTQQKPGPLENCGSR
jgi:uncharacterized protein (UPF0335 family)